MTKEKRTCGLTNKVVIITIVFSLIFSSVVIAVNTSTKNTISDDDVATLLLKHLFPKGYEDYLIYYWGPIHKGTVIRDKTGIVFESPEDGYVYFYDDMPKANFEHDLNYAFVSIDSDKIIKQTSKDMPMNFKDYKMVGTKIGTAAQSVKNVRAQIPKNVNHRNDTFNGTRYAVLISGGSHMGVNHFRYWNDLSNIYVALNHVCGFDDENIIVLCSDGTNPANDQSIRLSIEMEPIYANSDPDLDGDDDEDIMYSCTLANIESVFEDLSNVLTTEDQLFIFVTDHGSRVDRIEVSSTIVLWESPEDLTDEYFAELLDSLPQCQIICTFEQCFSGGFLGDVVNPQQPRVASSATSDDQYSWAMDNLLYDEYAFHWTAAIKGEDAFGTSVDADYNNDGQITMDEAFYYAESHDEQCEPPQYEEYPGEIGSQISLGDVLIPPTNIIGTIVYNDFEGGFYGIVGDDGNHYDPINLPEYLEVQNLRVRFSGLYTGYGSFHMWGRSINITEICEIIEDEGGEIVHNDFEGGFYGIVGDNGDYYDPINLPSIYQIEDLRVTFSADILNQSSIHMWGSVIGITKIDTDQIDSQIPYGLQGMNIRSIEATVEYENYFVLNYIQG